MPAVDVLRTAYREQLLGIAALDLTSPDPLVTLPDTASALADLAQAALEAALVIARAEVGPGPPTAPGSRSSRWARPAAAS